ncbi:MAG TPA: glycosyltransferase family 2 protein [Thermoanaerobaculia bacterium]|nr:glycosyltransferase family 2 protein [Thermoanaerobaculia bacterium]
MQRADPASRPTLSVVVPLYNEEANVDPLLAELVTVLDGLGESWEILLVDDGSTDRTWQRIEAAHRRDPAVRGLALLRNFGHQSALLAGLSWARGRAVVTLDGDLQHPPSMIPALVEAWRGGARVVHTARQDDVETGRFKRWSSRAFYRLFTALSGIDLPPGTSDFRLLDAEVLAELLRLRDPEPFLRGMIHWLGAPSTTLPYRVRPRHRGRSKFTLARMVRLSVRGLVSFTTVPLRLGIWAGLGASALAFVEIAYIVAQYLRGETVPGWASVLTVVSFMFGVLFLLLGILGTYLASVHDAIKNRPAFLIDRRLETQGEVRRFEVRSA